MDVMIIQRLLNEAQGKLNAAKLGAPGHHLLKVDGISGSFTEQAITRFQHDVVKLAYPDGRIDPGGKTLQVLLDVASGHTGTMHATIVKTTTNLKPNTKSSGNLTPNSSAEELVADPRIRAMLEVLAYTEGTGSDYGKIVNGTVISSPYHPELVGKKNVSVADFSRHPHILVQVNANLKSTAAGRYQFLKGTWDEEGMPDFSAHSQDVAAVKRMKMRGMIKPLLEGDIEAAVNKGSLEWASLPKAGGGSYYGGQTARSIDQIETKYESAFAGQGHS